MPDREDLVYWMAFGSLGGARPDLVHSLTRRYGSLAAAWNVSDEEIQAGLPADQVARSWVERRRSRDLETYREALLACERDGTKILTWDDKDYPRSLHDLENPPMVLYCRGTLPIPTQDNLAIVGTRRPSPEGQSRANDLARACAKAGIGVVSGLALGVDGEAHRGALESGGVTVAVLGCGFNEIYPPEHRELANRVAEEGLLLSEYPPYLKVRDWSLKARNRIIAAISTAVVVVEARERSGAFITARYGRLLDRRLFAMRPTDPSAPTSIGPERLIARGATPITNALDIVTWFRDRRDRLAPRQPQHTLAGSNAETPETGTPEIMPADEEEGALVGVLSEIDRYLAHEGLELQFLTETKLMKWVYEVANKLDLPITRSWYLRGCYIYSPLVSVHTLERWRSTPTRHSPTRTREVEAAVREVVDRWNLLYTGGEAFLKRFYREEAPEEYRRLYLANLAVAEALSVLAPLLVPRRERRVRGDLREWTRIETRTHMRLRGSMEAMRDALAEREELDALAHVFEAYTFLLEDVALWADRAGLLALELPGPARETGLRLVTSYSDNLWRILASEIAARLAKGPRASELQREMHRSALDLAESLGQSLTQRVDVWSKSLRPVERRYRTRLRTEVS